MLLSLWITSIHALWHFVHEPIGNGRVARERGWLVSIEQVTLFTWLLKFSSPEASLWWIFTWNKYLYFFFYLFQEIYPHSSSPNILATSFLKMFLWSLSQTTGHSPWIYIYSHIWPFLVTSKMNNQVQWLKFCPIRQFSFTSALWGLERDYSTRAVHFWMTPERHAKPPVNKAILLPCQLSKRQLVQSEKEKAVQQEWAVGPFLHVTYLWLQGLSGLIVYIPLPFDDGVLLCMPNFNIQLIMGSSGHMIIWWPVVNRSVSTKAQKLAISCCSKEK